MEKELLTLSFAFRPLSDDPDGSEGDLAAADELEDEPEDEDGEEEGFDGTPEHGNEEGGEENL